MLSPYVLSNRPLKVSYSRLLFFNAFILYIKLWLQVIVIQGLSKYASRGIITKSLTFPGPWPRASQLLSPSTYFEGKFLAFSSRCVQILFTTILKTIRNPLIRHSLLIRHHNPAIPIPLTFNTGSPASQFFSPFIRDFGLATFGMHSRCAVRCIGECGI